MNSKNEHDIFLEVDLDLFIRKTIFKIMSESNYLVVTNYSDIIDFTEVSVMTKPGVCTFGNNHVIIFTLKRVDNHYEFRSNIKSRVNPIDIFNEIYTINDYKAIIIELSSQLMNTKMTTSKEISYDLFIMISSLQL